MFEFIPQYFQTLSQAYNLLQQFIITSQLHVGTSRFDFSKGQIVNFTLRLKNDSPLVKLFCNVCEARTMGIKIKTQRAVELSPVGGCAALLAGNK
jgi:hypothetical protein